VEILELREAVAKAAFWFLAEHDEVLALGPPPFGLRRSGTGEEEQQQQTRQMLHDEAPRRGPA